MANEKVKNGNKAAVEGSADPQVKMYLVAQVIEGERFERYVPIQGIPFWVPQKFEDMPVSAEKSAYPRAIVGTIEDIVEIPENKETGFPARTGIVLSTKETYWVVPAGAAIERQIEELKLGAGERILIEYAGKAKSAKAGRQPANRFNISRSVGKSVGATSVQSARQPS